MSGNGPANISSIEQQVNYGIPPSLENRVGALEEQVLILRDALGQLILANRASEEKARKMIEAAKSGNPMAILEVLSGL